MKFLFKVLALIFFPLFLFQFSGHAQNSMGSYVEVPAQDATHLLWFTGHWSKSKKNTFIIAKGTGSPTAGLGSGGGSGTGSGDGDSGNGDGSVTVTPDGQFQLQTSSGDGWNKKIDDCLNGLYLFENELSSITNDQEQLSHHLKEAVTPLLNEVRDRWLSFRLDVKDGIFNPGKKNAASLGNNLTDLCNRSKTTYDEIIEYCKAHHGDKESDLHNPPPPEIDYGCTACDTNNARANAQKAQDYADEFPKPEKGYLTEALAMLSGMVSLGRSADLAGNDIVGASPGLRNLLDQLFNQNADPSKAGPCGYLKGYKLMDAVVFLVKRIYWRAAKLVKDNKTNVGASRSVSLVYMSASAELQKFGIVTNDKEFTDILANLCGQMYYDYKDKLLKKADWTQVVNTPFIISLLRDNAMLTGQESLDVEFQFGDRAREGFKDIVYLVNHFYMLLEMDLETGKDGSHQISHVKTDTIKIAPDFDYTNQKCYTWVLVKDETSEDGYPIRKDPAKIAFKLLDNRMFAPSGELEYLGTKHYFNYLKYLKMDFCNPGNDSIILTNITADPDGWPGWQFKGRPMMAASLAASDRVFQNLNEMKSLVQSGQAQQQNASNQAQGQQLIAQMKALQAQMGNGRDSAALVKFNEIQDLRNQLVNLSNNKNVSPILFVVFPLNTQNNAKQMVNQSFDAKEVNPREAEFIIHGTYKIQIGYRK